MTYCELQESGGVDLYFYDELPALDRARVAAHLASCPHCREQLQDLHAIRRVLADRLSVDSPFAGDWSGFMHRLDQACAPPPERHVVTRGSWRAAVACAAMLTIATLGVFVANRTRTPVSSHPVASVVSAPVVEPTRTAADRALAELTEQHLERSKLVVLGLAARDPQRTGVDDWQYERRLAGSLLSDTRLFRLAAQDHGLDRLAHVMGDLETVLLETSLSDQADPRALERVQTLIRKRDLVVKMQVVGSTGI